MNYNSGIEAKVASTGMEHTEVCLKTKCRLSITDNLDKVTPEVGEKRFSMLCTACHFYGNRRNCIYLCVCIKHIWSCVHVCVCLEGGTGGSILGHLAISGDISCCHRMGCCWHRVNILQEQNSPHNSYVAPSAEVENPCS